jgi:hypothetical protein
MRAVVSCRRPHAARIRLEDAPARIIQIVRTMASCNGRQPLAGFARHAIAAADRRAELGAADFLARSSCHPLPIATRANARIEEL